MWHHAATCRFQDEPIQIDASWCYFRRPTTRTENFIKISTSSHDFPMTNVHRSKDSCRAPTVNFSYRPNLQFFQLLSSNNSCLSLTKKCNGVVPRVFLPTHPPIHRRRRRCRRPPMRAPHPISRASLRRSNRRGENP